jgi:hypothetical protein
MRDNPAAFHNVKVQFVVQFASLGRISNPFFTKFTPTDYSNFYGWCDEQKIWREKSYNDVFGMLFISKTNRQLEELLALRLYGRILCTGVVRNTFQDLPWIEVTEFQGLSERMDTAILTHLHRGEKLMGKRLWQRAIAELSLAPGGSVPKTVVQESHKNLGICLLRMGEAQAAVGYLQSAASISKGKDFELENLLAMAKASPAKGLDRTVDSSILHESERPMWEAFAAGPRDRSATRVLSR